MKAVARIYWTFFTAVRIQRWLGTLGLVVLGLGAAVGFFGLFTDSPAVAALPFGVVAFAFCVLVPTAFATGGTLRALSAPQSLALLPHFRVRILVAVVLFVGSIALVWYLTGAGFVLLADDGAPEAGLARVGASAIYAVGALTAIVLSVFVITANPNWTWLTLPLVLGGASWFDADGPQRLAAAGISLPWIVAVASLGAWTAFVTWYLRVRRIRPVLLITETHGWTEIWRRKASRQQKRWPAHLTRGSAIGILLWGGRVQPNLPRQLLNAAALGAFLNLVVPLLWYLLPDQTPTRPPFTMFVWSFYAMLFTSFAALLIVQQSRRVWLRVPGSRTRVFRSVEREMARLYLRAITLIAALVAVSTWVFETPPTEAVWGFALMASAALYSMCMGLVSVRTAWPVALGLLVMTLLQVAVLGVERDQLATSRVAALLGIELEAQQVGALLAIQLAAAAVLRAVAELRWRSVDWLRLRPKRVVRSAIG